VKQDQQRAEPRPAELAQAELRETRALLHRTYGQLVLALANVPHYQN
jgi:hypothetical protein